MADDKKGVVWFYSKQTYQLAKQMGDTSPQGLHKASEMMQQKRGKGKAGIMGKSGRVSAPKRMGKELDDAFADLHKAQQGGDEYEIDDAFDEAELVYETWREKVANANIPQAQKDKYNAHLDKVYEDLYGKDEPEETSEGTALPEEVKPEHMDQMVQDIDSALRDVNPDDDDTVDDFESVLEWWESAVEGSDMLDSEKEKFNKALEKYRDDEGNPKLFQESDRKGFKLQGVVFASSMRPWLPSLHVGHNTGNVGVIGAFDNPRREGRFMVGDLVVYNEDGMKRLAENPCLSIEAHMDKQLMTGVAALGSSAPFHKLCRVNVKGAIPAAECDSCGTYFGQELHDKCPSCGETEYAQDAATIIPNVIIFESTKRKIGDTQFDFNERWMDGVVKNHNKIKSRLSSISEAVGFNDDDGAMTAPSLEEWLMPKKSKKGAGAKFADDTTVEDAMSAAADTSELEDAEAMEASKIDSLEKTVNELMQLIQELIVDKEEDETLEPADDVAPEGDEGAMAPDLGDMLDGDDAEEDESVAYNDKELRREIRRLKVEQERSKARIAKFEQEKAEALATQQKDALRERLRTLQMQGKVPMGSLDNMVNHIAMFSNEAQTEFFDNANKTAPTFQVMAEGPSKKDTLSDIEGVLPTNFSDDMTDEEKLAVEAELNRIRNGS